MTTFGSTTIDCTIANNRLGITSFTVNGGGGVVSDSRFIGNYFEDLTFQGSVVGTSIIGNRFQRKIGFLNTAKIIWL